MSTSGSASAARFSAGASSPEFTIQHAAAAGSQPVAGYCSNELSGSSSSAAVCLRQQVAQQQGPPPQQHEVMMQNSAHKQHMLELLGILMDLRGNNQQSLTHLNAAMNHTDATLQTGLRALQLASRVLASGGSTWVADRALVAAEVGMAAAIQRLNRVHNMAGQLLQLRQNVQQAQQQGLAAAAADPTTAAAEDVDDELRDTCSSVLRVLATEQC